MLRQLAECNDGVPLEIGRIMQDVPAEKNDSSINFLQNSDIYVKIANSGGTLEPNPLSTAQGDTDVELSEDKPINRVYMLARSEMSIHR